eukprot:XP_001695103.1 predicted protein [Chlamydomonas reinhardtii]
MSGQQSRQTCSNAAVLVLLCCCSWYQPGNSASQAPSTGLNGDAVRSSSGTGGSSGWPGLPLLFGGNLLGSGVVTDAAAATSSSSRRGNQQGNSDSPAATPLLAAPAEDWCGCFPGPGSSEQQTSTATAATAAAATATAMSAAAAALLETPWRLMSADYQHAPQRAAVRRPLVLRRVAIALALTGTAAAAAAGEPSSSSAPRPRPGTGRLKITMQLCSPCWGPRVPRGDNELQHSGGSRGGLSEDGTQAAAGSACCAPARILADLDLSSRFAGGQRSLTILLSDDDEAPPPPSRTAAAGAAPAVGGAHAGPAAHAARSARDDDDEGREDVSVLVLRPLQPLITGLLIATNTPGPGRIDGAAVAPDCRAATSSDAAGGASGGGGTAAGSAHGVWAGRGGSAGTWTLGLEYVEAAGSIPAETLRREGGRDGMLAMGGAQQQTAVAEAGLEAPAGPAAVGVFSAATPASGNVDSGGGSPDGKARGISIQELGNVPENPWGIFVATAAANATNPTAPPAAATPPAGGQTGQTGQSPPSPPPFHLSRWTLRLCGCRVPGRRTQEVDWEPAGLPLVWAPPLQINYGSVWRRWQRHCSSAGSRAPSRGCYYRPVAALCHTDLYLCYNTYFRVEPSTSVTGSSAAAPEPAAAEGGVGGTPAQRQQARQLRSFLNARLYAAAYRSAQLSYGSAYLDAVIGLALYGKIAELAINPRFIITRLLLIVLDGAVATSLLGLTQATFTVTPTVVGGGAILNAPNSTASADGSSAASVSSNPAGGAPILASPAASNLLTSAATTAAASRLLPNAIPFSTPGPAALRDSSSPRSSLGTAEQVVSALAAALRERPASALSAARDRLRNTVATAATATTRGPGGLLRGAARPRDAMSGGSSDSNAAGSQQGLLQKQAVQAFTAALDRFLQRGEQATVALQTMQQQRTAVLGLRQQALVPPLPVATTQTAAGTPGSTGATGAPGSAAGVAGAAAGDPDVLVWSVGAHRNPPSPASVHAGSRAGAVTNITGGKQAPAAAAEEPGAVWQPGGPSSTSSPMLDEYGDRVMADEATGGAVTSGGGREDESSALTWVPESKGSTGQAQG